MFIEVRAPRISLEITCQRSWILYYRNIGGSRIKTIKKDWHKEILVSGNIFQHLNRTYEKFLLQLILKVKEKTLAVPQCLSNSTEFNTSFARKVFHSVMVAKIWPRIINRNQIFNVSKSAWTKKRGMVQHWKNVMT